MQVTTISRISSSLERLFGFAADEIKVGDSVRVSKAFLDSKIRSAQRTEIGQQAKKYQVL